LTRTAVATTLCSDVRGEGLDAAPQGFGHVVEGGGQFSDLVIAPGHVGDGVLVVVGAAHLLGGGETADRPRDGPRQVDRKQDGDSKRHGENFQDVEAHAENRRGHFGGPLGKHLGAQHRLVALPRHGVTLSTKPEVLERRAVVATSPEKTRPTSS